MHSHIVLQSFQSTFRPIISFDIKATFKSRPGNDDITIWWKRKLQMRETTLLPQAAESDSGRAEIQTEIQSSSLYSVFFTLFGMYF